jgi:ribonuclease BN (tRNA processing enzyme)
MRMSSLDLTFIGSGNAFAPGGLCWNGFLANGKYLFETPPSALMALNKVGADPNELEAIVLSHHHGDHFLGLPFLLLHWKWRGRTKPVTIVGPRGTRDLALKVTEQVFPGTLDGESLPVHWIDALPGETVRVAGLQLEVVQVEHDTRLIDCLGYSAKLDGAQFGYTGDTILCDGVKDLARTSAVLISECASRTGRVPVHMNLVDDMPIVRALMAKDAPLILTHIENDVDTNGMPNTYIAEDFKTFRF